MEFHGSPVSRCLIFPWLKLDFVYDSNSHANIIVKRYSQIWFTFRCMFPRWNDWNIQYTRKGKIKKMSKQIFGLVVVVAIIIVTYQIQARSHTPEKPWFLLNNFFSRNKRIS